MPSGCWLACQGCWPNAHRGRGCARSGASPCIDGGVGAHGPQARAKAVEEVALTLGPLSLRIELWPDLGIGGELWPAGRLLAWGFAEAWPGLPAVSGRRVAELGAGAGLPSLACGMLGASEVVLTDMAPVVGLMQRNIALNGLGASCRAEVLDWESPWSSPAVGSSPPFDVVLAADVLYFEAQDPFVEALEALLTPGHTELVLAYRERTPADRSFLEGSVLARLEGVRYVECRGAADERGGCEIYVGRLRRRSY
mmetsp:Transcript_20705/g.57827  ORF Transcript_20705/g.57827 Transcript_20705/m.57827 type:complete len:254 (+) Transcript_20705:96-857(+)